jgi:hypothetical protein
MASSASDEAFRQLHLSRSAISKYVGDLEDSLNEAPAQAEVEG